ncbi:sugar phosphate isomerase/epimerase [Mycetocola sp. 2940]|uniref:sugar phosphate isomerase/epimerase family protein n=1 Tax=Mycetocola sp. 2940 TaxID=3156452 RepID=UPI003391BCD1
MSAYPRHARRNLALGAAVLLTAFGALSSAPAVAAPSGDKASAAADCAGRSVPVSKISFQLYSYQSWQEEIGIEAVLAELAAIGYKNVELYGGAYEGLSAEEFRALLKKYHLKASSAHDYTNEAAFPAAIDYAETIGQDYTGAAVFPVAGIFDGTTTYQQALDGAALLNRLGEESVRGGAGQILAHSHWFEFTTVVTDPATGETKPVWEVIAENTDPRFVTFEVDVFWASDAEVDVVDLLERYGDRIELLHIKDGSLPPDTLGFESFGLLTDVGEGDIDWAPILEAAQGKVKYYVIERDSAPASAEFARDSFNFLTCLNY